MTALRRSPIECCATCEHRKSNWTCEEAADGLRIEGFEGAFRVEVKGENWCPNYDRDDAEYDALKREMTDALPLSGPATLHAPERAWL